MPRFMTSLMCVFHVTLQRIFTVEDTRAHVALERFDVTERVNCLLMPFELCPYCELPVTHVTRVLGVRTLCFAGALSMRSVVVSADR